jgi:hypothetical protein
MRIKILIITIIAIVTGFNFSIEDPDSSDKLKKEQILYFKSYFFNDLIKINQDDILTEYFETVVSINKKRKGFSGYRIKIFAENNQFARERANNIRLDFNQDNDSIKAYVVFYEPNFEVHLGDYRTRFEALQFFNQIHEEYPEAYIIKTTVNYPEL